MNKIILSVLVFGVVGCAPFYSGHQPIDTIIEIAENGTQYIIKQTTISDDSCESGSGVLIESGIDLDLSGSLSSDEATSSDLVCSGANGGKGENGESVIVEYIDPCGDSPGVDEILLRFSDGSLVAWYKNLGLFLLSPGTYVTTDVSKCLFTVHSNLSVSW